MREAGHNFYPLSSRSTKVAKQRTLFAISAFIVLFLMIIVRLVHLMIINRSEIRSADLYAPVIVSRADILDRNGTVIATSLPTVSLYACPHEILDVKEAVEGIVVCFFKIWIKTILKKESLPPKSFYG